MPANPITEQRYYPTLSEVIHTDDLPEFLHFAEQGLEGLLDNIYYKNFQYSRSKRGDSASYSLDIVGKNIGLALPFGMELILNPDDNPDISSFPISLQYQWEMLAFLRAFKVQNFAFTPQAFYELGLQLFKLSDEEVVAHIINNFIDSEEGIADKFEQLVDAINLLYPDADIELPIGEEPTAAMMVQLIRQNPEIPDTVAIVMFTLYILDAQDMDDTKARLQKFYQLIMPLGIEEYIRNLITPKVRATLTLSAAIEFPTTILQPVTVDGTPLSGKSQFKFIDATFYADTEAGIGTEIELGGELSPPYSMIGKTGFIVQLTNAKLDISRKRNIPEADRAGYGPDFTGLYIQETSIRYIGLGQDDDEDNEIALTANDLFIGSGGLSGRISLVANKVLYKKIGNFAAELNLFSVSFDRGKISRSDIAGQLTIPGFTVDDAPAVIDIEAQIMDDGEFMVSAKPHAEFFTITLPRILDIHIRGLKLGREEKGFYIEISGKLDFTADVPGLGKILPKEIDIQRFRIWDNGDLEFEGGTFMLPKSFRLKVGPVNMEISQISFGAHTKMLHGIERKYRYFGFDGMINTGRAGVNATGNGIKYYFTVDHNDTDKPFDSFTSIDAIGIDLTIPGNVSKDKAAFILNGYLSMSNPDPEVSDSYAGVEYTGAISFSLPRLRIAGSAAMRLDPTVPAFLVDIGLEVPIPVPLGPTGLSIYGFRGLIGQHYLPSKTEAGVLESATWWEYYKAKSGLTKREGIEIDKFDDNKPGFSVGAGVSLATSYDKGYTFSSKLFLLLGLPDVFLLQGQAGILRSRIGLTKDVDPPFSAMIAIDSKSVMTGLGVNYRLPEGGAFDGGIIKLQGKMELAFFFNNSSGWYINLGKDKPESSRIQAHLLKLFQGYAYVMISARGFKAGAGARFDFNKRFGPVSVGVGAYIDLFGAMSFKPIQIGGSIQFGGYAYLKVWKFRSGLSVGVVLAFEAPTPFAIYGSLEVRINLPWPFKDIRFRFEVGWRFNSNDGPLKQPIDILRLPSEAEGYMPAAAVNILSGDVFPINYVTQLQTGTTVSIPVPGPSGWHYNFNNAQAAMRVTIPLDSYIDIDLLKSVKPGSGGRLGGVSTQLPDAYVEWVPAQRGLTDQFRHELQFVGLDIFCWNGNSWQPYYVYDAITALADEYDGPFDLLELKDGYWQFDEPNKYNKIRLLSQNMFTLASEHTSVAVDMDGMNFNRKDLFCYESVEQINTVDWKDEPIDSSYHDGQSYFKDGMTFTFQGLSATVQQNTDGQHTLRIAGNNGQITVDLQSPLSYLNLDLGKNNNAITVSYYVSGYVRVLFRTLKYTVLVKTETIQPTEEALPILYKDLSKPIQRVVIRLADRKALDYKGDLHIGKFVALPTGILPGGVVHLYESRKSISYIALYDRNLQQVDMQQEDVSMLSGAVARWTATDRSDSIGNNHALPVNMPMTSVTHWKKQSGSLYKSQRSYTFISNTDDFFVPFESALLVEQSDFSIVLTASFSILDKGISTLLSKIQTDPATGQRKGYSLHLYRSAAANPYMDYRDQQDLPGYSVLLTCYDGNTYSTVQAQAEYTMNCDTGLLPATQYAQIAVTVSRTNNQLCIYINREQKIAVAIPAELDTVQPDPFVTELDALSYMSTSVQRRLEENAITQEVFIEENQLLDNTLNKTIQPVWRPDTIYAVVVKVQDVISNVGAEQRNFIYGFKTAGPIGHFHEKSAIYEDLALKDQTASFKLANLKHYIDYERSFPDAQGRYDRSKPVFYDDAKIGLIFTQPYINAMYSDWDADYGTTAISSRLDVQLLDPYGGVKIPQLVEEQLPDVSIDASNYKQLPPDQQVVYLLSKAASEDECNASPVVITKRKKRSSYEFPTLFPNRLYTAVFEAVYQVGTGDPQRAEVHRFGVITSRFADFEEQVASFIHTDDEEQVHYAIHPISITMDMPTLNNTVLKIWNDDFPANDPDISRYAFKYDRVLYGGLGLTNLQEYAHTVIQPIIHTDPATQQRRILAILVRNPEPFNNPNLPPDKLQDTVQAGPPPTDAFQPDSTIRAVHARDTSAVLLSNTQMNIAEGQWVLQFKYKLFNGVDYDTDVELYQTPTLLLTKDS